MKSGNKERWSQCDDEMISGKVRRPRRQSATDSPNTTWLVMLLMALVLGPPLVVTGCIGIGTIWVGNFAYEVHRGMREGAEDAKREMEPKKQQEKEGK